MPTWPAKDPDSTLDYLYTIPLDEGDSVADHTFTLLIGDVVLDSESRTGAAVTAWLSGGTDGELAVFYVEWETAGGRIDDDLILLDVIDDAADLVLAGYMKPAPSHLAMRYPAFVGVPASTVRYWLTDAERGVDESWMEGDYAAGLMALAAHNMTVSGLGSDASAMASIPAGLTSMKSGSLSLGFSESAAKDRISGSYASTRYGAEYLVLLRRNRAGPRVMATGALPYDPMRYPMGET